MLSSVNVAADRPAKADQPSVQPHGRSGYATLARSKSRFSGRCAIPWPGRPSSHDHVPSVSIQPVRSMLILGARNGVTPYGYAASWVPERCGVFRTLLRRNARMVLLLSFTH